MDGKNRIADRIAVYGILILLLAGGIAAFVFSRDFSGYSDMALGLGKAMGFTFPENFDRPDL